MQDNSSPKRGSAHSSKGQENPLSKAANKASEQAVRRMSGNEKPLHSSVKLTATQEAMLKKALEEAKSVKPASGLHAPAQANYQKNSIPAKTAKASFFSLKSLALRPRLLPLTILASMAMLGIKVGDVMLALQSPSQVQYASAIAALNDIDPAAGAVRDPVVTQEFDPAKSATLGSGDEFSSSKQEVLERLKERREELESREKVVKEREALLSATEIKLDEKLRELNLLKSQLNEILGEIDDDQEAQIQSLVTVYEKMKPKSAAQIFNNLEMDVLLDIVTRMKEQKSSAIISAMDVMRAQELTIELSRKKDIPEVGEL